MFVKMFASGTNVQRLARCGRQDITGVIYTAYSQLEQTETNIIRRRFYCAQVDSLRQVVAALDVRVMPSWTKIWAQPWANRAFLEKLLQSLAGQDTLRPELNLSHLAGESIDCFMLLVSADKKPMAQIARIAKKALPDWHVKILNGDFTTNRDAEWETRQEINQARSAGKRGVIVVANQMGSRSYSVPEIQATVIAYDRGSVDATQQKVSRCLTPGKNYQGQDREWGHIVDLSFDPNRSENINRLILEEACQVQRSQNTDFTSAVRFVLSSMNLFTINEYGHTVEISEDRMFEILGDNDCLLRVADVAVDVQAAVESGIFDILLNVNTGKGVKPRKPQVGEGVINSVRTGGKNKHHSTASELQNQERVITQAIRSLNMSATSVFFLAAGGDSYRECLEIIQAQPALNEEFSQLFGVHAADALMLIDAGVLNEAILDVVVQNSRRVDNIFN